MDVSCIHRCKGSCHLLSSPINICAQRIELNPTTNCLQFPNTKMEWTVRPFAVSQQQQLQQINNSVNECIHHSNSIVIYTNLHFVDTLPLITTAKNVLNVKWNYHCDTRQQQQQQRWIMRQTSTRWRRVAQVLQHQIVKTNILLYFFD